MLVGKADGLCVVGAVDDSLKQPLLLNNGLVGLACQANLESNDNFSQPREFMADAASLGDTVAGIHQVDSNETSSEDECGERRALRGSGVLGKGLPLRVTLSGRTKWFSDGAGLCSPGRWRPEDRSLNHNWFRREWLLHGLFKLQSAEFDVKKVVCELACGRHVVIFPCSPSFKRTTSHL